jgi:hypothetical protein
MESDLTTAPAAKLEVLERVRRFAALRGAQRAIEPSACSPGALPAPERWREIRERLAAISKSVAREGDALEGERELAEIDELLAALSQELLAALEAIPLSQLRATLPTTFREYSEEIVALLDLCVGTAAGRSDRARITEYLITMIASEQCVGVRRMVRDPVHISPALHEYSSALREALDPDRDSERLAEAFDDAARRLQEASNVSSVLDEVRTLKGELGESIFAPSILRAVIDYNLAVWNRHEDLLDQTRTNDWIADSELILSIEVELDDEQEEVAPLPASSEPSESELERAHSQRAGIAQIEAAIAGRLNGEPLESELLFELLSGLELSEREKQAFSDTTTLEVDELFRAMVATGMAIRSLPELGGRLSELSLRPAVLQSDWIRWLNERIREKTKQLIAGGGYAEAREVSATKHRFLYASLSELIRNATRKAGAGNAGYIEGSGDVLQQASAEAGGWHPSIIFLDTKAKRASATAILLLVLLASIGLRFNMVKPRPVDIFSQDRLTDLSSELDSGYRKQGFGRLFVGTVSPGWKKLSVEERRTEGGEIAKRLGYQGVREVMLYDQGRDMQFHFAGGVVRYPTETSRAP